MFKLLRFLPLLLVTCCDLILSGHSKEIPTNVEPRIINGMVASGESTKFVVSIRLKKYDTPFGNGHICGGSLIGPNKVLTAAHCLYNAEKRKYRKANEFVVVMGTLNRKDRTNGSIVSDVSSLAYMNTFSYDTMRDDLGLMFLKQGLSPNSTHPNIEPIAIANETTATGSVCQVTGWGKTLMGNLSTQLMYANVTTISRQVCMVSYQESLLKGMICAGYMTGGTDACQGDSGGPLVYNNSLIGIVSWGNGCALPLFPGIYTDVYYYRDWILSRNAGNMPVMSSCLLSLLLPVVALGLRIF